MAVLIYTETAKGKIKKSSLEAVNYGNHIASMTNTTATALIIGDASNDDIIALGKAGAKKILQIKNDKLTSQDPQLLAIATEQAVTAESSDVIIFSHDFTGKALAPRLSARIKAGLVAGAVSYPVLEGGFAVNLDGVESRIKVKEVKKETAELSLPDADLVVSAGRGMRGPENWGMIEDLAKVLGAATACSRPVADIGWRPHHEHVGQTGVAIRPNLYIAIGISGAIQHLAGVNGSKTIVVINKDAEAPFFKSADYGIVGDAFEIVPKLVEAAKKLKAQQN